MVKFQIRVDEKTFRALRDLSQQEFRDWRLQAGFLVREALNNRGLLTEQPQSAHDRCKIQGGKDESR
jgi:hypothetical protein